MRPTPLEKSPEPDLGAGVIPKERYTDPGFARREWERMWTRVWLLAGREGDVAKPGDWFTFEIGPESIIVARDRAGVLHAHYNVCLHRGNRLCEPGMGNAPTFSCRYHAWEWNLDGTLRHATDAKDFGQALPDGLHLGALRVDTWGGFVWVTMSADVEPLREYLGVIPEHLAPYRFDEHVLVDDVTLEIDCNWKTCVDAFNEAYHVQGTHPELLEYSDDVNVQIDLYGRHSRFIFPVGVPSPRLGSLSRVPRWLGDIVLRGSGIDPETFDGGPADVKPAAIAAGRALAEQIGMDLSALRDDQLLDDYHYTIFPNVTLNVHGRGFWLFRHRPHPTDPNKMLFDFQDYLRWPASLGPRERAPHRTHVEGGTSLGVVLDQDLHNLPRVQAGMQSRAFTGLLLNAQERRIRHFHRTLETYVGDGAKPAPAAATRAGRPRLDEQSPDRWARVPRSEALPSFGIGAQLVVLVLVALVCSARHMIVAVNSDGLYPLSLYRDLFERHFHVAGWILTPAPYLVPDLAGIFVLYRLLPDPGWAFAAYEALYLAATLAVVLWIGRLVGSRANDGWAVAGTSMAAWILLREPSPYRVSLDMLFATNHGGAFLLGLVLTGGALELVTAHTQRASVRAAMVLLIGLGALSDPVLVPQFLIPLGVATGVAAWRQWIPRERLRRLVLPAVAGVALAIAMRRLIDGSGVASIGAGISHILAAPVGPSIDRFVADVPRLLHEEAWAVVFGVVWFALTAWAALRANDEDGRWRFLSLTIAVSVPVSVAATVLNGRYENIYLLRQFLPAMLLPALFIGSAFWWRRGPEHAAQGRTVATVAALCVLGAAAGEATALTPSSLRLPYPASVRCVDDVAARIGVQAGLGDYWSAKLVRELSRKGVEVNQVDARLKRFDWVANPDWFATLDGPTRRPPQYGFVIANNLPVDLIVGAFGEPAERVDCAGLQVLVYGRPGDAALRDYLRSPLTAAGG